MILTREEDGDTMSSSDIKAEYTSSLADLTCNSKPLISVLTILADENQDNAAEIVAAIEEHLAKVPTDVKLPILYLVDCIAKNVGGTYRTLFSQNIVSTFCNVFRVVNEKTRAEMFKLRQTWNDIFPQMKLYAIDVRINMLDPAWPVTAVPPSNSIHFNPKFLKTSPNPEVSEMPPIPQKAIPAAALDTETYSMQQKLIQKQKELIELQQKKLELELLQTQVKLQKQLNNTKPGTTGSLPVPVRGQNILLKPEVAKQLIPGGVREGAKLKPIQRPGGAAAKISPVNRALLAAGSRPSRDPRLARQQTNNGTTAIVPSGSTEKSKAFPKPKQAEQKLNKPRSKSAATDSETKPFLKSSSSQDSPTKRKVEKIELKSPNKSPSRHKKKDYGGDKKNFKESKRERDTKSHKSEASPPTFKGVKTAKSRNYIRRNRSSSYSPEPNQDVDLRVVVPSEKHPRTDGDDKSECPPSSAAPKNRPNNNAIVASKTTVVAAAGKDVDLRQLPAVVGKKRLSTETLEHSPSKKTKMFDVLFGNEDTDLRTQMPVVSVERPPTPPPPIISLAEKDKESPKKSSNLDAIRAKLATATGRDKIMAKSFRKKRPQEDEDLRVIPPKSVATSETLKKIIISPDDEQCIKAGTMTKEQEKQLMNKIIAQIEHQKLKEAQRKDKEESVELPQPVSDEDMEATEENDPNFGDKDDRVSYNKFPRENRDSRRGGPYWRGGKRRPWENPHLGPHPRPGLRPWMHPASAWRPIGPNFGRPLPGEFGPGPEQDGKKSPEVPGDLVVDSVNQDDIKTINIDGIPRDIRYYDETAIVFMNWDDPKEISFQNGTRRVVFDDKDIYFLSFNEGYKDLSISGTLHRVRLGAPSREIFIDGKPYECYFGGPGITIDLNSQMTTVKMDGPPPQVKIGNEKRVDLVAGKVNLIIDAKILVPVFLDAKVQKFVIDGETHTLKFVDALKTVLINDVPFNVEFGGLPKPITVHDKKHFIRFSVLPRGVKPGSVAIKDMEGSRLSASPTLDENSQDASSTYNHDINEPALPVVGRKKKTEDDADNNSNSPHFFQSFMHQNNLDVLSSVMTSIPPSASSEGYQVETLNNPDSQNNQSIIPQLPASVNINELFQKLVATGIVATSTKEPEVPQPPAKPAKRPPVEHMKPVTFNRPESLKIRQSQLYEALYTGMQCSSCGMRFPPEQSMHYSQHLDWHFRQNRKGKKNIRVAASRRWYYSLSDWKNYEEIEDLEEREKNYFDQQQSQVEGAGEDGDEEVEIPSVPADPDTQDAQCEVCQDKFDHFFNEEKEEWHLRNAIRVDDKTYHPVCYEDYQTSLLQPADESVEENVEEPVREEVRCDDQNIPGLEIILDDDDDEEEEKKEEVVIEESDESKNESENKEEEEMNGEEEEDDDVIINEVVPEKIEVDDDREYVSTHEPPVIKVEQIDDGFMDVEEGLLTITNGGQIKIKSEPLDPDDLVLAEEVEPKLTTDTTRTGLISSMDGNTELTAESPAPASNVGFTGGKIKINISKPLPQPAQKEPKDIPCDTLTSLEPVIDPTQPLPPGEEPIQLNIKPALRGVELKKRPPVKKGSELTGMCSIM